MQARLIVHGGAWRIPEQLHADHVSGVRRAVAQVYPKLRDELSAVEAVEAAVRILEEDPTFDAGRGAFLNAEGEIELDAIIMDGAELDLGAVAALKGFLHPITVARAVMERTEYCVLVGAGARAFARRMGIRESSPEELVTPRELASYERSKDNPNFTSREVFAPEARGTVGAVAMDSKGNLAAATSTGGSPLKLPGRVGDSPLVGAGAYADNQTGAASATGWGEAIMKVLLTKTACDLARDHPAEAAAEAAIGLFAQRVDGLGGLILVDRLGNYGLAHNTPEMAFAYADAAGGVVAGIRRARE